ncbi:MAG: DHH family phosphoesterase [Clostridium sp.]|uniref:DHH family phosphoesterase n=1 Tax=Clostridium sp. TaxID=1506 RepID=UPI003F38E66E
MKMKCEVKSGQGIVKGILDLYLNKEEQLLLANPQIEDMVTVDKMYNGRAAVDMYKKHIELGSTIVNLQDVDVDGVSSSAQLVIMNPNIITVFHSGKQHGIEDLKAFELIKSHNPNLVILPDSSTNDVKQLEELTSMGIDVIILDHHDIENNNELRYDSNKRICLVNPKDRRNRWASEELTGAGLTFIFVSALATEEVISKCSVLAALGQIGDCSDVTNKYIRYMIMRGLQNVKSNEFVKLFVEGIDRTVGPMDLSFGIISLINSVCRVGDMQHKTRLFEALVGNEELAQKQTVMKRRKNKATNKFERVPEEHTGYALMKQQLEKVKAKQKKYVDKALQEIELIENDKIVIAVGEDIATLSGLIANKLTHSYNKPSLVLSKTVIDNEVVYRGSARSSDKLTADFNRLTAQWGSIRSIGHNNAFGISIKGNELESFIDKSRTMESEETVYEVANIGKKPSAKVIDDIIENTYLFGGKIEYPLLGLENTNIFTNSIKVKGSMISFYSNGVEMFLFNADKTLIEKINYTYKNSLRFNIVGQPMRSFMGGNNCIFIQDIELLEEEEVEVDDFF